MDNGARRALIPLENKWNFLDVSADTIERVDPIFYGDPITAAMKSMGMNLWLNNIFIFKPQLPNVLFTYHTPALASRRGIDKYPPLSALSGQSCFSSRRRAVIMTTTLPNLRSRFRPGPGRWAMRPSDGWPSITSPMNRHLSWSRLWRRRNRRRSATSFQCPGSSMRLSTGWWREEGGGDKKNSSFHFSIECLFIPLYNQNVSNHSPVWMTLWPLHDDLMPQEQSPGYPMR